MPPAPKQKLSDTVKSEIVRRLACFDSPKVVQKHIREKFAIDVNWFTLASYDPTRGGGTRQPSKRWKELFEKQRREFLREYARHAVTHQTWRIATYQRMIDSALESGNHVLAANLMEQATKDLGGAYTNRRILEGDPLTALAQLLGVHPKELTPGGLPADPRGSRLHLLAHPRSAVNGNGAQPH